MRKVVLKVLDSPLAGLSPWFVYSLTSGPERLEVSVLLALATALVVVVLGRLRGGSLKMLELSDLTFFGGLAIVVAVAGDDFHGWLELWSGEVANLALVVISVGSILARRPFTLQYAREQAPRELWDNPDFIRANYVITGAWAIAFVLEAASGAFGDAVLDNSNNLWTGWVIQTAALIFAAQFTIWYQDVVHARGRQAQGIAGDPPPTVAQLFAGLTVWIIVAGVLTLVFDGGPTWFGITLIVVGVLLTHAVGRAHKAQKTVIAAGT